MNPFEHNFLRAAVLVLLLGLFCMCLPACAQTQTKVSGQYDLSVGGSKKP